MIDTAIKCGCSKSITFYIYAVNRMEQEAKKLSQR